jgi:predicted negative regulator of RcsB-dependent stress response
MWNSFPYDEWSETVTDFWTFGPANSTGTYIMTVLGCILMVASLIGWVWMEKQKLERQAAALRATGAFDQPAAPGPQATSSGD